MADVEMEVAVTTLRKAFERRDASGIEAAVAVLRRLEADHPEVHLANAYLLEVRGSRVEAGAARIRGYERSLETRGDPAARKLLDGMLKMALAERQGLAMVRPAAQLSSDAAVLETFVRLACNEGQFEEAEVALRKLENRDAPSTRDLEEAVALARRVETLVGFEPDGSVTCLADNADREPHHHSVVTQALIGAAARRSLLSTAFGRSLPRTLTALGLWSDAAARGSMHHMLTLGQDACAEAFFDCARPRLSRLASIKILDEALVSCLRRGAVEAFARYADRLNQVSQCRLAGLTRLASHVGVEAAKAPPWAPLLQRFYAHACARAETLEASGFGAPHQDTPWLAPRAKVAADRIDVFLKCVKRPFDIRPFVSFWLECFSDTTRYRVRLLDDSGLDLKTTYARYPIHDSRSLREGPSPMLDLLRKARRPLNMLKWESVANLTPFVDTETEWFWNVDADDIRPLPNRRTSIEAIRGKLQAVESYAARSRLMAMSYDLWASAHYLIDHGYHWTFGLCLCRSAPRLLDAVLSSMGNVDIPQFWINIDHLLSRASDGLTGGAAFADFFASFVFDGVRVLQFDVNGKELYHSILGSEKMISYHSSGNIGIRHHIHEKTLVI